MPATYRNDVWNLGDELGLGAAGDRLARLTLEAEPPFTVGVTGKWGSGKTSLMRRAFATLGGKPLEQDLGLDKPAKEVEEDKEENEGNWTRWAYDKDGRDPVLGWDDDERLRHLARQSLCIWFSPWQHQADTNVLLPLLHEMQTQYSVWLKASKGASTYVRKTGMAAARLFEHLLDGAATLAIGKGINVARGTTEAVRQGWRETATDPFPPSDGQRFHLLFEDAIEQLLQGLHSADNPDDGDQLRGGARLIVFVDDLDRCEEGVVVRLLESIKLYLSSRRCVFVLGLDDTAVAAALGRHWQGRTPEDNRDYLEKLFQATLPVPLPDPRRVRKLIEGQLKGHGFPSVRDSAGHIESLLEPNPRKVKTFLNSLCAQWNLMGRPALRGYGKGGLAVHLILFHYLRLYHRPVWRLLERQPWALRLLRKAILRQAPSEPVTLDADIDPKMQDMMTRFFEESFLHVLPGEAGEGEDRGDEDRRRHRRMDLDRAVALFQERQDRKRSDEVFIRLFGEHIAPDEEVPERLLCLHQAHKETRP